MIIAPMLQGTWVLFAVIFSIYILQTDDKGGISINHQLSLCTESLVRIVASCSGLLLLTSQKKKELIYHVLNPLIRETFSLPQSCKTGNVVRCGLTVNGHLNYQVVVVEMFILD